METQKDEAYFKEKLTPERYAVLREKGTEAPFSGALLENKETGMYVCGACGQPIFSSKDKFDSGTGWPSFFKPAENDAVLLQEDTSHGMHRMEVKCRQCGSHLGHVFDDAPKTDAQGNATTGQRFCINSCSLDFKGEDTSSTP